MSLGTRHTELVAFTFLTVLYIPIMFVNIQCTMYIFSLYYILFDNIQCTMYIFSLYYIMFVNIQCTMYIFSLYYIMFANIQCTMYIFSLYYIMFANIQCTMYILWRTSKDFFLAITCCPCMVWSHLLYLTVLQWLHCNMLGNYSIATNVWMCRSTAWVVVPDNHTIIAVYESHYSHPGVVYIHILIIIAHV